MYFIERHQPDQYRIHPFKVMFLRFQVYNSRVQLHRLFLYEIQHNFDIDRIFATGCSSIIIFNFDFVVFLVCVCADFTCYIQSVHVVHQWCKNAHRVSIDKCSNNFCYLEYNFCTSRTINITGTYLHLGGLVSMCPEKCISRALHLMCKIINL